MAGPSAAAASPTETVKSPSEDQKGTATMPLRICQIAAEVTPFAKTGGLGDVAAGLSRALGRQGHDVRLFLPFYARVAKLDFPFVAVDFLRDLEIHLGPRKFTYSIFTTRLPESTVDTYFVHCPALYHHDSIYSGEWDEYLRYALLTRAALECCQRMGWAPDIVHVHEDRKSVV